VIATLVLATAIAVTLGLYGLYFGLAKRDNHTKRIWSEPTMTTPLHLVANWSAPMTLLSVVLRAAASAALGGGNVLRPWRRIGLAAVR
jgi:hypothetical protein